MKNLKLLNKKYLSIIFFYLFIGISAESQEPVDIWNIEEKKVIEEANTDQNSKKENIPQSKIYEMQSQNQINNIQVDTNLNSKEIKIIGLYDPKDYGLKINMWLNSDGFELKRLFTKLNKIELSKDANEIMKISLLTNAHHPKKNIKNNEFLTFKSNWLIKNFDLKLI